MGRGRRVVPGGLTSGTRRLVRPSQGETMPDAYDPTALVRHAVAAGDWRLVELIARMLAGVSTTKRAGARRAYETLVVMLGLASDSGDYDRSLMEAIERLAEEFLARIPAYVWDGDTLPVPIEDIADTHTRPPRARRPGSRQGARRPRARPRPDALGAPPTRSGGDLGQRRGSPAVAGAPTVHDRSRARALAPSPRGRRARSVLPLRIHRI